MAKKFLVPIDLNQNELQNARLQNLASAPGSPVAGQIWYNSTSGRVEFRGASVVVIPTARGDHTGTQPASTISDFDTQVRVSRLDQMAAPIGSVGMGSQKIISMLDGTAASDGATWGQVQNIVNGTDWKNSVRIASTADMTLSGLAAFDGITPVANDRILVKNQTTGTQNGIYLASAGAWTRTTDADGALELTTSTALMVEEGTIGANTQWRISTTGAITLGVTSIAWVQFGAGTAYTAGSGIGISGNVLSVDATIPRKYSVLIGNGSLTSITITHSLGTKDIVTSIREAATDAGVECDWVATSTTQATYIFSVAPAANQYRVTVIA